MAKGFEATAEARVLGGLGVLGSRVAPKPRLRVCFWG